MFGMSGRLLLSAGMLCTRAVSCWLLLPVWNWGHPSTLSCWVVSAAAAVLAYAEAVASSDPAEVEEPGYSQLSDMSQLDGVPLCLKGHKLQHKRLKARIGGWDYNVNCDICSAVIPESWRCGRCDWDACCSCVLSCDMAPSKRRRLSVL